ncbi:alpha/beta fold hydrolase [Noviherbaspirillum aerium]|uniref:alpha/beta fold hydrolase n=1 Tax=Noviherbaspirillum aerium TaxID=2588497 RepID=UPI00124EBD3C|nr:alpha/beta hydrolase [Noviherbaspirillum aerium]
MMHVLFLPGAGGGAEFWHPLGALLPSEWKKSYLSWPGLGKQPHDPSVNGFDDLLRLAAREVQGPTVVVAQSMGGIVGVRLALERAEQVTHLVLVAASGGIDVSALGAQEWRAAYREQFPDARPWITEDRPDHSALIPNIACPTLLIWGTRDAVSPPQVGRRLAALIPDSRLYMVEGGDHDLARDRAADIAPLVIEHLQGTR